MMLHLAHFLLEHYTSLEIGYYSICKCNKLSQMFTHTNKHLISWTNQKKTIHSERRTEDFGKLLKLFKYCHEY